VAKADPAAAFRAMATVMELFKKAEESHEPIASQPGDERR
jgi:hypothetical protein